MVKILHLINFEDKYKYKSYSKGWKFIHDDLWLHRNFVVAIDNNKAVGIASYVNSSFVNPEYIGVAAVEVKLSQRNKGLSKLLVDSLFEIASQNQKGIRVGHFEIDGIKYLKHQFEKNSLEFGTPILLE